MKVAYVLYDEFTLLDIVGPFNVLDVVPGTENVWVGETLGLVSDHSRTSGLPVGVTFDDCLDPDVVIVPGGLGTSKHLDGPVVEWLRAVAPQASWVTSVCTGSLLLGAAGLLERLTATSHWAVLDRLPDYGATPSDERVVLHEANLAQGTSIGTAAGVSSGIDMALTLAAKLVDEDSAKLAQLAIEYDPQPPFDAGSPSTAPRELRDLLLAVMAPRV